MQHQRNTQTTRPSVWYREDVFADEFNNITGHTPREAIPIETSFGQTIHLQLAA